MNPFDAEKSVPNYWLSCMLIDEDAMAPFVRGEQREITEQIKHSFGFHDGSDRCLHLCDGTLCMFNSGEPWSPYRDRSAYGA